MKKKNIILIHDIGSVFLILVGILGIVRLIGYLLYGYSPEIDSTRYLVFTILEIAIGIFGLIELNRKYLLKK